VSELPGRCCAGGGGGDWKGRIKDALPNVDPGAKGTPPPRTGNRLRDDIQRTEYGALDSWNNEDFFKYAGAAAVVLLVLLLVFGGPY